MSEDTAPSGQNTFKRYSAKAWEFLKVAVIAAAIVLPIRYFLFQPFIVKGESMIPNFHSGDYLVVDEISYLIGKPQRGEVVVLKYPLDTSQRFIKRVVGLPGETVEIKDRKITINSNGRSFVLDEKKYLDSVPTDGNVTVTLRNNQYFVLGDNRRFSYDSRMWGVLPQQDIIGRAVLRLFPLSDIKYLTPPDY